MSINYKISTERCPACSENHKVFNCDKFKNLSIQERKNILITAKLCFICLNSGHTTKDCKTKSSCRTCKGRNNSLLHVASNTVSSNSTGSVLTGHSGIHFTFGFLPTAMIPIANSSSTNNLCRALLDSGSQLSFVTEDTVQGMELKRLKQSITINGVGNVTKSYNSGSVIIQITTQKGVIDITAYILPTPTHFLSSSEFSILTIFYHCSIILADPNFNEPDRIEMILGSNVFEEVVLDGKFTAVNGIHFRNRVFGWIAPGKHPESHPTHSKITSSVCNYNTFDLRKFWETPRQDTNSGGDSM